MLPGLKVILLILLILYGLAINGYLLFYLTCRTCIPLVAQLSHITHWLTLSSLLMLPLALFVPYRWQIALWLLPGGIAFGYWYGAHFLPEPAPAADQPTFKAMTFNVLGFAADPHQTFAIIDQHNPDILGLQEMRPILDGLLREKYPYAEAKVLQGVDGLALYSRFPILSSEVHLASFEDRLERGAKPPYLRAVLEIEGQQVAVYVFHPTLPFFELGRRYDDQQSRRDYDFFVALLNQESLPMLVLCDCNTTPYTRQYQQMRTQLNDAFYTRGWGFGLTHPGYHRLDFPVIRIDYLWHSDHFTPLAVRVGRERGTSDHWPVIGQFSLKK